MIAGMLLCGEMCWDLIRRNSEERLHLSVCLPLIKVGWKMMSMCTGTKKKQSSSWHFHQASFSRNGGGGTGGATTERSAQHQLVEPPLNV